MSRKTTYDAGSIAVLEGLEAVRVRPGMYIGSVSTKGLNHLVYEIVDNAVDEHLAGFCTEIHVTLEKDGSATVSDNGRGVPVDMHQKGISAAPGDHRLMLLGSPPDMVHRAPAHGAHIRMQNSAIYSPVRFKYYTIPFGKLQVAVGGWGRKFLLKRFE